MRPLTRWLLVLVWTLAVVSFARAPAAHAAAAARLIGDGPWTEALGWVAAGWEAWLLVRCALGGRDGLWASGLTLLLYAALLIPLALREGWSAPCPCLNVMGGGAVAWSLARDLALVVLIVWDLVWPLPRGPEGRVLPGS